MAEKIVIDADPAIGYAFRDVDDALAILYVLAHPGEFEVLGITAVFGNAALRRTAAKAAEVLHVAGRDDIPVHAGASGRGELGSPTEGSEFLVEIASRYPGEITVLAIGPLTNVHTAALCDPGFYGNVKRIVIMGGALEKGLGIPYLSPLEFNFYMDHRAADGVLSAPCEKVVVTGDLCRQVLFTRRELDALWSMQSRVAVYLAYRIEPWLRLNSIAPFVPWKGGFVPWDVVAAVYLRRPELFSDVEEGGWGLREGHVLTGAIERAAERDGCPAKVPMTLDGQPLLDEFLSAIARFGKR